MKNKTIILTEEQLNYILTKEMINEGAIKNICKKLFYGCNTIDDYLKKIVGLISMGALTVSMAVNLINFGGTLLSKEDNNKLKLELAEMADSRDWKPVCNDAIVTVYNAVPEQCNNDIEHTASMFRLNLNDVASHKIVAMERTFMKELGLKYGDVIKIVGTHQGKQDGVYQIQDTMNKRFAGQHKIDILVPNHIKYGGTLPDKPATVYVLNDKNDTQKYLDLMSPSLKENKTIKI